MLRSRLGVYNSANHKTDVSASFVTFTSSLAMGKKPKFTGLSRFLPQEFLSPNATSLSEESQNQSKPAKKRKTDARGPVRTRYDATALVPHYTTAHEVPENLQKCPSCPTILIEGPHDSIPAVSQIFRNESDTFLYTTKDVY
jgi:hypothetical protein